MKISSSLQKWALAAAVIGIIEGVVGILSGLYFVFTALKFYNVLHKVSQSPENISQEQKILSTEPERKIIICISLIYAVFNFFFILSSLILIYGSQKSDRFYTIQWVYMTFLSVIADGAVIISFPLLASICINRVGMEKFEHIPVYFSIYAYRVAIWVLNGILAVKVKKRAEDILDAEEH